MNMRFRLILTVALSLAAAGIVCAQNADNRTSIHSSGEDRNRPRSFSETLEKLRIEKEKKEFNQMVARGEEALKISTELEDTFIRTGRLSEQELEKVETVEKLVKKIRGELGGDDDEEVREDGGREQKRLSAGDAIRSLRATSADLFEQLKKTTRFTISAAAIQTSNAVLRIARFLRIGK
ncbi:MAG TPA: hypothetical protein VNA17_11185 [Pyrinomonadaceae bacterium]|nr:hypothetical protein [Pyrinomonadaceae bacterium]